MFNCKSWLAWLLAAGMLVTAGCGQQDEASPEAEQPETEAPDAPAEFAATAEMEQVLAQADALDGQEDQVVTRCASCALGMDGSEEHALRVGEYTMYFCAEDCKQAFSEDIAKSVLAMKIPEADASGTH